MRAAIAAKSGASKQDLANEHYRVGAWALQHGFADEARTEFRAAVAPTRRTRPHTPGSEKFALATTGSATTRPCA